MFSGVWLRMDVFLSSVLLTILCFFCGIRTADAVCYETLNATDIPQIFTSPGYPLKYAANLQCTWHIRAADPSQVVVLETLDSMIHSSIDCQEDTAALFEGPIANDTRLVRKWCSDLRYYFADSNSYFLFFRTDSKFENRGFQVRYYQGQRSGPCNRDLVANSDVQNIISPGYPVGYYHDLSCTYSIQAEQSTDRIQIDMVDMHIENSVSCEDDNITIVDPNLGEYDVGTICGQMTPSYQSSGSRLQIKFNSNRIKETRGFMIKFKSISNLDCRNDELVATDVDSYLVSPGYPNYYSNLACSWTILSNNPQRTVEVEVMQVAISSTPPACNGDRLEVDYLDSSKPNEVICGSSTPSQKFVSLGSTLSITFTSDTTNEGQGFYIRYRLVQENAPSASCDQTLAATEREQILTSPGYPHISLKSQTCSYTIRAQSGYHIRVTLNDLDIELSKRCIFDSLTISDGSSTLNELWCGDRAGEVVNSLRNEATVTYSIDNSNNGKGFSLKYSAVSGTPSKIQTMTMPTRSTPLYLTSPGFEKRFPRGISFTYIFTADPLLRIRLRVTESYLRYYTSTGACIGERVMLYDGPSSTSSKLRSVNTGEFGWCALDLPVFVSSSNYMTMVYKTKTSSDHERIGFVLSYEQGNFTDLYPYTCGGMYEATSGRTTISSPNYPGNYGNNMVCKWTIWATSNTTQIRLAGSYSLAGGSSGSCGGDFLNVYDGAEDGSNFLEKLCGTGSDTLQSIGNLLTIVMKTDGSYTGKGFSFLFYETTDPPPCGGSLTASSTSLNLRKTIRPNLSCKWIFTRETDDAYIRLKLTSFYIGVQSSGTCGADRVEIYDGNSESSDRLASLCGYKSAATYIGTGEQMMVKLVTGVSPTGDGFSIEYRASTEERCTRGNLRAISQISYLQSPSYPDNYASNLHCTWLIDSGYADRIVFFDIKIASIFYSAGCADDHLAAYDGISEATGVQLGKWCRGVGPTGKQQTTQQYLTIVFHTNEDESDRGFRLSYWNDVKPIEEGGNGGSSSNIGAIVGGVIGGLVLLAVIVAVVVIIFCVVRKPRSKNGNRLPGSGQAIPPVAYQPQMHNVYMTPASTSLNGHAYDNNAYNVHPQHQGSKYEVPAHGHSQPEHVQGKNYSFGEPRQENVYSQLGPAERDDYFQFGPMEEPKYSEITQRSPPRHDYQNAANNIETNI
ncbi:cubilin-like [Haliotis rubra]|uniref:cubilin-like n=1 Tax=Haliotis rubra TaxID=36100 RepID=UPI001EE54127|nr:cubilin-like [Haliotis rubra]